MYVHIDSGERIHTSANVMDILSQSDSILFSENSSTDFIKAEFAITAQQTGEY